MLQRILSGLGCFGLVLLAILFALGVTEAIKYVSALERTPPDDLPHAYKHRVTWSWPQSDADWPRVLPKWPFDPVLIQGGPLPDDPEEFEETHSWPGTIHPKEAITAIEGAVVKHRSFWYEGGKPKMKNYIC